MNNKGSIIAELRREAGYTQKSLATALHITDKAVSKWERGVSLPDVALLPKLSLLLGADVGLLLSEGAHHEAWEGLLDLRRYDVDLSMQIYDKPMVYYLLSHFLLLGITKIHILTTDKNQSFLSSNWFQEYGFVFSYDLGSEVNLMILNKPCFLFGSDLTRQFQGAMVCEALVKLVPNNRPAAFLFCPAEYTILYDKNPEYLYENALSRTLGRGMICMDMENADSALDIANFIKMYQKNTGVLIGSLEEISYRKGILSPEKLIEISGKTSYGTVLKEIMVEINK